MKKVVTGGSRVEFTIPFFMSFLDIIFFLFPQTELWFLIKSQTLCCLLARFYVQQLLVSESYCTKTFHFY